MPPTTKKQVQSKFYHEDVVRQRNAPAEIGLVARCWHDHHDVQIPQHLQQQDPLFKPLEPGQVGVAFFPSDKREICSEADFDLVDRSFQVGDPCKRHPEDAQSGVVSSVDVRFKVAHAITDEKVDKWFTRGDIDDSDELSIGSIVIYGDWVGQVQEMFDEMVVQTADGRKILVPELTARLSVGDRGADILPPPNPFYALFGAAPVPSENDTVIALRHSVIAVCWMAVNQKLTPEEAASRLRPHKFWKSDALKKLTFVRGIDDKDVKVGDSLSLRNAPIVTRHGTAQGEEFVVDTLCVYETETTVTVLWQDGSTEVLSSKELCPYENPDEYDCWPGDHVMWKTEDHKQPAVVQKVDSTRRTAEILLQDGKIELVPVLELDPHGSDKTLETPHDSYGVRMGDQVFIHAEGRTNGYEKPKVPVIGELEAWTYEAAIQEDNGEYAGWRKEMNTLGFSLARNTEMKVENFHKVQLRGNQSIDWFGDVTKLNKDGTVVVLLPNLERVSVPLERLSRLIDGLEQLEDAWADDWEDTFDENMEEDGNAEILGIQSENGEWLPYDSGDEGDWEEDEGEDQPAENGDQAEMEVDGDHALPAPSQAASKPNGQKTKSGALDSGEHTSDASGFASADRSAGDETEVWKQFDVLPSAPVDHAFYSSIPLEPSRQFMSRLSKEYKALMSSLPDSILVRTYEDRTDLLRCLIIGPENTPYEDAPFVIDWMLEPSFPQTPPIAHFFSWTNGNGRVNPNLYEEGKVCLSIIGTWSGDRTETWNPARSSLLQTFVSIQGLVLVKEPWFCEPSYEHLRGTAEGKVNSRLYSEKAYVLSRGFVRRALETPLGGLEEALRDIYFTKGRLRQVIDKANNLVVKSEKEEGKELTDEDEERAVPRLTSGGILALSRTMKKLEQIYSEKSQ